MTNVYSTSKAMWHFNSMAQMQQHRQPYPIHVQLIISDQCNHSCAFCSYRQVGYTSNQLFQIEPGETRKAKNPHRLIPVAKCYEILDDCRDMGVLGIQLTGGGEPTIHPQFSEIAQYALDRKFKVGLVTNGSLLHRDGIRSVALQMAWVRVSIDAGNMETYCKIRDVSEKTWHETLEGVRMLCRERQKRPLVVGAGFVVTPWNWKEMWQAVELYRSLGVDNVRLGLMFSKDGIELFRENENDIIKLANDTVRHFSAEGFTVYSRVAEKMDELRSGHPRFHTCWYQNLTTYIGGDQNVYRCCVYSYNKRGLIGSLKEQTFRQLWDSQEKHDKFTNFDATGCERCQFTAINKEIDYTLNWRTAPLHVEFP